MDRFEDLINYNELIDLPMVGRKYTLSNNHERLAMSKIDHFLILIILFKIDYFSKFIARSSYSQMNLIGVQHLLCFLIVGP